MATRKKHTPAQVVRKLATADRMLMQGVAAAGGFSDEGDTFSGAWELSRDDTTWEEDLKITYRRAG